ncbi:MAG: prenyltransferase [Anaerolineales bacterium]|nr:MAG: prenyltransferase [Anaerolineales bacterium]
MNINFSMWKTAIWSLVKMDSKTEWEKLDVISKWLIATRSGVTLVTVYTCVIAGLLALRDDYFSFVPWLVMTVGLFIAHGTNNLLNDYTDFSRGVDSDNYFRTQYGVHPLVQGFWTKPQQLTWLLVSGVIAFLSGVYALFYAHFDPIVIGFFALGALVLLFYTYPLKYLGVGELAIFLIWGPIMVAGVYIVLAIGQNGNLNNIWYVVLAGVPFGLSVVSINIGKHIDKMKEDASKGVGTLPVRIGQTAARYVNIAALVLIYLVVLYLIFIPQYFTPLMLIIFFAIRRLITAIKILSKPRPEVAPPGFPFWPTFFSAFNFNHNRLVGGLFILGLIGDTLLRIFLPTFWPLR